MQINFFSMSHSRTSKSKSVYGKVCRTNEGAHINYQIPSSTSSALFTLISVLTDSIPQKASPFSAHTRERRIYFFCMLNSFYGCLLFSILDLIFVECSCTFYSSYSFELEISLFPSAAVVVVIVVYS